MVFKHYSFKADRRVLNGLVSAKTGDQARAKLIKKGWQPVIIQRFDLWPSFFHQVKRIDVLFFLKNLALLLKSGITLGDSLQESAVLIRNKSFKKVILQIAQEVEAGNTMTNVLRKHQNIFSLSMINLLRIGEESGNIGELVERIADQEDKGFELRKKMKSSAAYPLIVLGITAVLLVAFFVFVLPRFQSLFLSIGADIPAPILFFMNVGRYASNQGWLMLLYVIIFIYLWRLFVRVPQIGNFWNSLLLRLPVVSSVIRDYNLAVINRMLGMLILSGIDAVKALRITAESVSNSIYAKSLLTISAETESGQTVQASLNEFKYLYPSLQIRVVSAGEKSGNLGQAFEYLSLFYYRELDYSTRTLSTIMEPALLLLVGLLVGGLALSIITPIYDFVSTVGN